MRDVHARSFFIVGVCCVILGGLVAAVTAPLGLANGSWVAAYLVLVTGVAQCAFGFAQLALARRPISTRVFWVELICWNLGSAAVLGGTVAALPYIVDIGGALLIVTLVLLIRTAYRSVSPKRWVLWGFRLVIVILVVSIPFGLTMAHLRSM